MMGFVLFLSREGLKKMRPLFIIIFLNLVLIPAAWLLPLICKIHFYTVAAIADAFLYIVLSILFFIRYHRSKQEERPGLTLRFILLQTLILFSIFLFKLSELLLLKHCL